MASITLKGNPFSTVGDVPAVGSAAPAFQLLRDDLSEVGLDAFPGKKKVISIFPSVDTPVCATSVRSFNEKIAGRDDAVVVNVSMDLPFALKRFCGAEGIDNCETLSAFRSSFADDWGVKISDGPLAGLCSRAVVVVDENDKVVYAEQVPEIAQEPNYDAALAALS